MMKKIKKKSMKKDLLMTSLKLFHLGITIAGFVVFWLFFYSPQFMNQNVDYLVYTVYFFLTIFLYRAYDVYNIGYARITDNAFGQVLSNLISTGIVYVIASILFGGFLNPLLLLSLLVYQCLFDSLWSLIVKKIYMALHKAKRTVVVYRNRDDLKRVEEIRHMEEKFRIEKLIENPSDDYKALESEMEGFDAIIVAGVNATLRNGIAKYCIENGKLGYFAPHVGDIIMQGAKHISSFSVPILNIRRTSRSPIYIVIKRLFDIILSFAAIVLLSPIYLVTALVIKLYDHGPALYKQVRLTKDGREFKIWKFRSMRVDAEKDGVARLASENDDRITPVGKFIRACRLDELPQLFNILFGDMSFVGPRPERPEIAAQYEEEMPAFSLRLQVKAGLTGYAQIYGKYNSTPYDKLQMDLMYVNRMSISEDLRLIFATLRILFLPESTEGIAEGATTAMNHDNKECSNYNNAKAGECLEN